jgi:hypothetical protein
VDYAPLRQLLQAGEWKEADKKTFELMSAVADRESEGWLKNDEQFSCEDLRIIDREWANASNGKFGFAAQKQIWEEVGRPGRSWNDSIARQWRRMYIRLGWRTGSENESKTVDYNDLEFSSTGLDGHLPAGPTYNDYETVSYGQRWIDVWWYGWMGAWNCNL